MRAVELCHGPDRSPLCLDFRLTQTPHFGAFAYHGTLSRGLVNRVHRLSTEARAQWPRVAPVLEDLLCCRLQAERANRTHGSLGQAVGAWWAIAREAGLLSLHETALAARRIALSVAEDRRLLQRARGRKETAPGCLPERIRLWAVKEGHTSSVWQLRLAWPRTGQVADYCLNIGRDLDASEELLASTKILGREHEKDPDHVVEPLIADRIDVPGARGASEIAFTLGSWVPGLELHVGRRPGDTREDRFARVAWFLNQHDPESGEPKPQRVLGEWLDDRETDALWARLQTFLLRHTVYDAEAKSCLSPAFEVNQGDFVQVDDRLVAVAASSREQRQPLDGWALGLVFLPAGAASPTPSWRNPGRALDNLCKTLAARPIVGLPLPRVLRGLGRALRRRMAETPADPALRAPLARLEYSLGRSQTSG